MLPPRRSFLQECTVYRTFLASPATGTTCPPPPPAHLSNKSTFVPRSPSPPLQQNLHPPTETERGARGREGHLEKRWSSDGVRRGCCDKSPSNLRSPLSLPRALGRTRGGGGGDRLLPHSEEGEFHGGYSEGAYRIDKKNPPSSPPAALASAATRPAARAAIAAAAESFHLGFVATVIIRKKVRVQREPTYLDILA